MQKEQVKKELIKSASGLNSLDKPCLEEFKNKKDLILSAINKKMKERKDIKDLVTEKNLLMMEDNHSNHMRFMESIFAGFKAEIFVETILWVFRAYRSHGFKLTYWPALLNTINEIIQESLSKKCAESISAFYSWMIIHIPTFVNYTDE